VLHPSSFVGDIEDLLFPLQTAVRHFECRLVERLRLVETVTVRSSVLVSVQILFSFPGVTVPELAVALVATREGVGALSDLKPGGVLEDARVLASSPVGAIVDLGAQVAGPSGRRRVVIRLVVARRVEHRAGAVAATAHLHRDVLLRDHLRVESGSRVVVSSDVNDFFLKNVTRLLCDALSEVLVVDLDAGDVALVAGNDSGLLLPRALGTHVVVAGPVEVLVGPLGEGLLAELLRGAMVVERELGVGLEELGDLHSFVLLLL